MRTTVLSTHTAALFQQAVAQAVELLRAGEPVALPTETVYGLAANALDAEAVRRVFEIKGRPAHNPVIVHVASQAMARRCASRWPETADVLAAAFWPGPLTLVLPRSLEIPDIVTAGGSTVGVRWPSHPFIQEVIRACGFPLAAPSANLASSVSPTTAEHVHVSFGGRIPLIVDGGPCQVGIESTVVDLTQRPPRVLRPGMITEQALQAALAEQLETSEAADESGSQAEGTLRSPGQLPKHYSPKARLAILKWRDEEDLKAQIARHQWPLTGSHVIAHTVVPLGGGFGGVSVIPRDAEAFARAIYAELHRCDATGVKFILVEAPPDEAAWEGIADRLRRAASPES